MLINSKLISKAKVKQMPISQPRILKDTLSRKAAIATGTATMVKNINKIKNEIVNMIIPPTCALSPKYKLKVTQAGAACQPSCFLLPAASAPAVIVRMAVILPLCLVHLLVSQLHQALQIGLGMRFTVGIANRKTDILPGIDPVLDCL